MSALTAEIARTFLRYDAASGALYWRERSQEWFSSAHACRAWNNRFAGKEAFTAVSKSGYKYGCILRTTYRAHRIIWLIVNGEWPNGELDHANRVKTDNRISNLRVVSRSENMRNISPRNGSISGVKGVTWCKKYGKWYVYIGVNGKAKWVGGFHDLEDAIAARKAAEQKHGYAQIKRAA